MGYIPQNTQGHTPPIYGAYGRGDSINKRNCDRGLILKEIFTRLKKQNPKIDIKLVKKITSNMVKYHIIETFLARKELEKKEEEREQIEHQIIDPRITHLEGKGYPIVVYSPYVLLCTHMSHQRYRIYPYVACDMSPMSLWIPCDISIGWHIPLFFTYGTLWAGP
jgi:hypothetical protein